MGLSEIKASGLVGKGLERQRLLCVLALKRDTEIADAQMGKFAA